MRPYFYDMHRPGLSYARTGAPWAPPWQVIFRLIESLNVSHADLKALSLLHLDAGTSNSITRGQTIAPSGSRSVHLFGSLEGLRMTGLLESATVDQGYIAPYLIPAGCEGEFLQQRANTREQVLLAGDLASSVFLVKHWLRKCIKNHPECQADPTTSSLLVRPKRMVDLIDYQGLEDGSRVRVVDCEWLSEPYCALSYRWPHTVDSLAILTPQSEGRLYAGIHPRSLHHVIQDACKLCHELGFRYLWVDALCIIQGDEGDWHAEAEKIWSIYLNATCTIASIDSTSLQRSSNISLRPSLRGESDLRELVPTSSLRSPEQVYVALEGSGNFAGRPDGELDTRAWAFQEKVLSRRIISITKDGIFWDCLHHSASGPRPAGILGDFSPNFRDTDDRAFKAVILGRVPHGRVHATTDELYWYWRKGVQDYTKRKITRGRDRLIALQGIVFQFGTALHDECVLGIWRNNAARCLAWFVDGDEISGETPHTNNVMDKTVIQAPSWSWISVRYPIQYRLYHHFAKNLERTTEHVSEMVSVLEISMRPKRKNGFNDFEGRLRLQGAVVKGILFENHIYILNQSPSAPDFDEISQDFLSQYPSARSHDDVSQNYLNHSGLRFGKLRQNSSSGAADAHFFHARFLADNVGPSSRKAVTPLAGSLDRHSIAHDDEVHTQSTVEGRATSRPEEVACLLLFEGGYGNMLSARYFVVLSPCEPASSKHIANIGLSEYFIYRAYFTDRIRQDPVGFKRIGLCAFDRRQVCQDSAPHKLSALKPCTCLGQIMTLDII